MLFGKNYLVNTLTKTLEASFDLEVHLLARPFEIVCLTLLRKKIAK